MTLEGLSIHHTRSNNVYLFGSESCPSLTNFGVWKLISTLSYTQVQTGGLGYEKDETVRRKIEGTRITDDILERVTKICKTQNFSIVPGLVILHSDRPSGTGTVTYGHLTGGSGPNSS